MNSCRERGEKEERKGGHEEMIRMRGNKDSSNIRERKLDGKNECKSEGRREEIGGWGEEKRWETREKDGE